MDAHCSTVYPGILPRSAVVSVDLRSLTHSLTDSSRPTQASILPTSTNPSTLPPTALTRTLRGFPFLSLPNCPTGFPTPRVMTSFILRSPICKYLKSSCTSFGGCKSPNDVDDLISVGRADVKAERTPELDAVAFPVEDLVCEIGWNPTTRDGPAMGSAPSRTCPAGRFLSYCGGDGSASPIGRTDGNASLSRVDSLRGLVGLKAGGLLDGDIVDDMMTS